MCVAQNNPHVSVGHKADVDYKPLGANMCTRCHQDEHIGGNNFLFAIAVIQAADS